MHKKKVLLDINVVLDVLLKREEFIEDAATILKAIENNTWKGYISASSIDTLFYIIKKNTIFPN